MIGNVIINTINKLDWRRRMMRFNTHNGKQFLKIQLLKKKKKNDQRHNRDRYLLERWVWIRCVYSLLKTVVYACKCVRAAQQGRRSK
jgi:hypothetical protein